MTTSAAVPAVKAADRSIADKPKTTSFIPIVVTSVAWTSVVFFFGGLTTWALTGNLLDGIAMGLFIAFWAGPGFGFMIAMSIWSSRNAPH